MASPGRIVQKGGKSVYEPLTGADLDVESDTDPIRASIKHCPHENITWCELRGILVVFFFLFLCDLRLIFCFF